MFVNNVKFESVFVWLPCEPRCLSLSIFLFANLSTFDNGAGKFPLITDYAMFCTCYPAWLPKEIKEETRKETIQLGNTGGSALRF
jgi:hypothetical protein